jgi:hypothetical protein
VSTYRCSLHLGRSPSDAMMSAFGSVESGGACGADTSMRNPKGDTIIAMITRREAPVSA